MGVEPHQSTQSRWVQSAAALDNHTPLGPGAGHLRTLVELTCHGRDVRTAAHNQQGNC